MISNDSLGKELGVTHATISRYRSGDRLPTLDIMATIAAQFGWSLDDQYKARQNGNYQREFESRVVDVADRRTLGKDAAEDQQGRQGQGSAHAPTA